MLLLKPTTVFGTEANSGVELGLIGCGSRGNWIAPFFGGPSRRAHCGGC